MERQISVECTLESFLELKNRAFQTGGNGRFSEQDRSIIEERSVLYLTSSLWEINNGWFRNHGVFYWSSVIIPELSRGGLAVERRLSLGEDRAGVPFYSSLGHMPSDTFSIFLFNCSPVISRMMWVPNIHSFAHISTVFYSCLCVCPYPPDQLVCLVLQPL